MEEGKCGAEGTHGGGARGQQERHGGRHGLADAHPVPPVRGGQLPQGVWREPGVPAQARRESGGGRLLVQLGIRRRVQGAGGQVPLQPQLPQRGARPETRGGRATARRENGQRTTTPKPPRRHEGGAPEYGDQRWVGSHPSRRAAAQPRQEPQKRKLVFLFVICLFFVCCFARCTAAFFPSLFLPLSSSFTESCFTFRDRVRSGDNLRPGHLHRTAVLSKVARGSVARAGPGA